MKFILYAISCIAFLVRDCNILICTNVNIKNIKKKKLKEHLHISMVNGQNSISLKFALKQDKYANIFNIAVLCLWYVYFVSPMGRNICYQLSRRKSDI